MGSIKQKHEPVSHWFALIVQRPVHEPGHVLPPIDHPPAHAVIRDRLKRVDEVGGVQRHRILAALPVEHSKMVHGGQNRLRILQIVVLAPVRHEVDVVGDRDIIDLYNLLSFPNELYRIW